MREFEDRFVTLGLPYRVIGGPRFYERAEIRDALAYLRLVNQPADDLAFERIINTPRRGLGDATLQSLQLHARRAGVPLLQAARSLAETEELKAKPRAAVRDLVAAFDRWRAQKDTLPHTELAEIVLDESGYTEMWQKDRSADAAGRLENLKELVRSMEEFENLGGFLEHISLVMDTDRGEGAESVSIMTLAFRQGARVRHRVPARLGGRPAAAPALARRSGPRRTGRGAPSRACRASPRAASRQIFFTSNRRIHGLVVVKHPVALSRRIARGACRGHRGQGRLRKLWRELRRLALRHDAELRIELHHAGLAARAGAQSARRRI
jgi:DNA helicase-2/ATP-dependent DNA helicase PcrA